MEPEVVGREDELNALTGLVRATEALPRAILLEGEPGIGKTTLLRAVAARARENGYRLIGCRPAGGEIELAYAALGDMLEPVLDEVLAELPGPQRHALAAALLIEEPTGAGLDRRAVAIAFVNAVKRLQRDGPVA